MQISDTALDILSSNTCSREFYFCPLSLTCLFIIVGELTYCIYPKWTLYELRSLNLQMHFNKRMFEIFNAYLIIRLFITKWRNLSRCHNEAMLDLISFEATVLVTISIILGFKLRE